MNKIFLLLVILTAQIFISCFYRQNYNPLKSAKIDDLNFEAVNAFNIGANSFYKIPRKYKEDVYVYILRSQMLDYFGSKPPAIALLSFGSLKDKPDCKYIENKVGKARIDSVRKIIGTRFYCFDTMLTSEKIISSTVPLKRDSLNYQDDVDSHMGWFSATGDSRPVEKMIWNIALNPNYCRCMMWAISSVMKQDSSFKELVYNEARKYQTYPDIDTLLNRYKNIEK